MAFSLKHAFSNLVSDDPVAAAAGETLPSHWNAEHTILSTALSVVGRAGNTDGAVDAIVAGTDGYVLRRSGTSIGFGLITAAVVSGLAAVATSGSAADLSTGTLASARLVGSYTGITGVGTLAAGVVPASLVTGLATVATSGSAADLGTGTLPDARLSNTITAGGPTGSATVVPVITYDAHGRLTAVTTASIAIAAGSVSGLAAVATSGSASDLSTGTLPFARIDLTAAYAFTGLGATTISAAASGAVPLTISGYSLTGSQAQSMVSWAGTLNTSGSPDVFKISITDTARGASTTLFNIYAGAAGTASKFSVDRSGNIFANGTISSGAINASGDIRVGAANTFYWLGRTELYSPASGSFQIANSGATTSVTLTAAAAATLQLGAANAASPVAQTLQVQSVVSGTTDTAGANWTFNGSQGTGTGNGGAFIFNVAKKGSTGTAQNSLGSTFAIVPGGMAPPIGSGGSTISVNSVILNGPMQFGDGTNILGRTTYTSIGGNPAFASGSSKGWTFYTNDASVRALDISSDGTSLNIISTAAFGWNSSTASGGTVDAMLTRAGAGIIQHGNLDVASGAVAQFIRAQSNTGAATTGPDFTIQGTKGTTAGGSLIFQTAATTSYATVFSLSAAGAAALTPASGLVGLRITTPSGTDNQQLILDVASGQRYSGMYFANNGANKAQFFWDNTNGYVNFSTIGGSANQVCFSGGTGANNLVAIDGTGNVKTVSGGAFGFTASTTAGTAALDAYFTRLSSGVMQANNSLYTNVAAQILGSKTTITGGSTGNVPTLTAGPVTGNPTKWLPYDDNGTTRYIPAW